MADRLRSALDEQETKARGGLWWALWLSFFVLAAWAVVRTVLT